MTVSLWAVVLDVTDLERGAAFWGGLLGLERRRQRDEYLYLSDVAPGVGLVLQRTSDPKASKNRMHLEFGSDDPEGTIEWVLSQGGSLIEEHETEWYALAVLADPDGNEFCVNRRVSTATR